MRNMFLIDEKTLEGEYTPEKAIIILIFYVDAGLLVDELLRQWNIGASRHRIYPINIDVALENTIEDPAAPHAGILINPNYEAIDVEIN